MADRRRKPIRWLASVVARTQVIESTEVVAVRAGRDHPTALTSPFFLGQFDRGVMLGLRGHPGLAVRAGIAAVAARTAIAVRVLVAERRWRIDGVCAVD